MIWVMTWSCDSVELVALELGHISKDSVQVQFNLHVLGRLLCQIR